MEPACASAWTGAAAGKQHHWGSEGRTEMEGGAKRWLCSPRTAQHGAGATWLPGAVVRVQPSDPAHGHPGPYLDGQ